MNPGACLGRTIAACAGLLAGAVGRGAVEGPPALRELAATRGLRVGTAVKAAALDEAVYRDTLLRNFAIVTPENELKMKPVRPARDRFEFAAADRIVDFAQQHGLRVRGHTLCWAADDHQPAWLLQQAATPAVAQDLLREHIFTVMQRYHGRVRDWDVVNESIANSNQPGASPYVDGYWLRALGEDYIALAFRLAREADPAARLFYNDYDHGRALGPKSDRIFALLQRLKAAGVPLDGVGLQLHCSIKDPPKRAELVANFRRLADLGLVVQVTELDVETMTGSGTPEERLAQQAQVYRDVFAAALEAKIEAVVTWGFTDKFRHTALLRRKNLPPELDTPMWLFDAAYDPKPAFDAVTHLLREPAP
ncbi:MAG: endo,4-beta-xylanase [Verrucomicrobiota bacterium]|nr:endo,4-beta-xylanase [Verrucomicrobiota bacterium]